MDYYVRLLGNRFIHGHHARTDLLYIRGKHHSPETKAKISEKAKGRPCSKSTRKKNSIRFSGSGNPMFGKHHTKETRQKMREHALSIREETSERVRNEWKKPEARRKKVKGVLKSWQNPEIRQRHLDALHDKNYLELRSEISRELWKNEEFREKTISATFEAIRNNKPYIWKNVYFGSQQELECAKMLLDEPIEGFNCHIRINGIEIDFLTESGFMEYHPYDFDGRSHEQYLRERIERISTTEFAEIPVFLLTSLSEAEEFKRGQQ